ncbi:RNA-directed DNA polymerase [Chromobacterium violaceum]|uniref:RNA-directed DNA polymerase n=1 Tax=Chromobacterium violaceum TaxID=536 RepID=UPI0009B87B53|nr:RNA-directed DNA polymerase [Chromobacterium violaceum]
MANYIIRRPVNSLKKIFTPSYLGAKIKSISSNYNLGKIIELSIRKRLHSSEDWNYYEFHTFKGISEEGRLEYRTCLAPSPSTSAAEAYILNYTSQHNHHKKIDNIYSYIRTEPESNFNYKHYLEKYNERNEDILKALKENDKKCVVFFDIKNFYSSIDQPILLEKIRLDKFFSASENKFIINFIEKQLKNSPSGVPIGTEISHVLADIYLNDIDTKLSEIFGKSYFRYVDDISIVCAPEEISAIRNHIKSMLNDIHLTLNEEKFEKLTLASWTEVIKTTPVTGIDFNQFCEQLSNWMEGDIRKKIWLDDKLRDEKFQIPTDKIFNIYRYKRDNANHFKNDEDIIIEVKKLKNNYISAANEIGNKLSTENSRWHLQKTRRTLNPLFYLLEDKSYNLIKDIADESLKLRPQYTLSDAILNKNYSELIKYPGSTIDTFCELIKISNTKIDDEKIQKNNALNKTEISSLTTLAMFNITNLHPKVMETPLGNALRPNIEKINDELKGFEAEIESLRIGLTQEHQTKLLTNEVSEGEEVLLNSLELGKQEISP